MSCLTLFLGGTVNNSSWRNDIIPLLEHENLNYFNPVVEDWNESCIEKEDLVKNAENTVELYVITSDMKGVYSIAEMVDSSNKKPSKTIVYIDKSNFDEAMLKSLEATLKIVKENKAMIATSLYNAVYLFKGLEITHRSKRISILARRLKYAK